MTTEAKEQGSEWTAGRLPSWDECDAARSDRDELPGEAQVRREQTHLFTVLHEFIYENEPCGEHESALFRERLANAINFCIENSARLSALGECVRTWMELAERARPFAVNSRISGVFAGRPSEGESEWLADLDTARARVGELP